MKYLKFPLVALIFLALFACNSPTESGSSSENKAVKEDPKTEVKEAEPAPETAEEVEVLEEIEKVVEEDLSEFIPEGYVIMDQKKGDLNKDPIDDILLVLKSEVEETEEFSELDRPVIILLGREIGGYAQAASCDRAVLCASCGGVWGDPYNGLAVKNGYFSIEHYGGSNWRWTRIITFKFDPSQGQWFLHKDGGDSFHTGEPDKVETSIKTVDDFGVINFRDFDYEGEDDI